MAQVSMFSPARKDRGPFVFNSLALAALVLFGIVLTPVYSIAETAFIHRPPQGNQLAEPGAPLVLRVSLLQSREVDYSVQGMFISDGRAMTMKTHQGFLDEYDRPTYEFTVPTPLAELAYFFVITDEAPPISSDRYIVRRPCIPKYYFADDLENADPAEEASALIQRSESLDRGIQNYERSIRLLEELQELIKE